MQATAPSVASPSFDFASLAATRQTLACLSAISQTDERGWLAELYRGGRLVRLRRVPREHGPNPAREQWLQLEGYDGPVEFEMRGHGATSCRMPHPGEWVAPKRDRIRGFSRQSRMRLLYKLNSISSAEAPLCPKFVTLTYPRELLPSPAWAKRQLNAFLQAMFKRFGNFPVIWRLEHQEDGAVHFHLLCWYTPFLPWWWVAREWDGLIGNQVDPRESASTQVRAMRSWRQTAYYVSKYIAKDDEGSYWDQENGRHWGCRFWRLLPVHRVLVPLSEAEGYAIRRWTRRYRLAKGVRTRAFDRPTEFCGQAEIGLAAFMPERDIVRMLVLTRGASPLPPRTVVLPTGLTRRRAGATMRVPKENGGKGLHHGKLQSRSLHSVDGGEANSYPL